MVSLVISYMMHGHTYIKRTSSFCGTLLGDVTVAGRMGMEQKIGYRNRVLLCCHLGLAAVQSVLLWCLTSRFYCNFRLPYQTAPSVMVFCTWVEMGTVHVYRDDCITQNCCCVLYSWWQTSWLQPCISDIKHIIIQLKHVTLQSVGLLKHIKIKEVAPTCFGLQGNHHQGAATSA